MGRGVEPRCDRVEHQIVENTEYHRARANLQRQRKQRHKRKPKVLADAADRISEIAQRMVEKEKSTHNPEPYYLAAQSP